MHLGTVFLTLCVVVLSGCGGSTADLPPTFSGNAVIDRLETEQIVGSLRFVDPEGKPVIQRISGGADGRAFSLSSEGTLSFVELSDYENPLDANADNSYQILVTASDGKNQTSQEITINVTNALEGRVGLGPVSGSLVFVDLDEDFYQDDNEQAVVSDQQGYFVIRPPQVSCQTCTTTAVAVGGVDTTTGVELKDLHLFGPILEGRSFSINPLSMLASGEADLQPILRSLGLTISPASVIEGDYWKLARQGDKNAIAVLKVNQQLVSILRTANGIMANDTAIAGAQIAAHFIQVLQTQIAAQSQRLDLTDHDRVYDLLSNILSGIETSNATSHNLIDNHMLRMVAAAVAANNSVITEISIESSSVYDILFAVLERIQGQLQALVIDFFAGNISVSSFREGISPETLYANLAVLSSLPDLDGDGMADLIDQDDDGDTVVDREDVFPLDPSETLDTDHDGVGNNADTDDDGDAIVDEQDAFPLDSSEKLDTDNDGIGDNADEDDDNDGIADQYDDSINIVYSVSGSVSATKMIQVDSDINGQQADKLSNDSIELAQPTSIPVKISGYANIRAQGEEGFNKADGDLYDYYEIEAKGGERVKLVTSAADASLDLYLYDDSGHLVEISKAASGDKLISVPASKGVYYIAVEARHGASSYLLTVDAAGSAQSMFSWSGKDDFVTGDIIVKFRGTGSSGANILTAGQKSLAKVTKRGTSSLELFSFGEAISQFDQSAVTSKLGAHHRAASRSVQLKLATLLAAEQIAEHPSVEYAEANYYYLPATVQPNDANYQHQWHLSQIQLPEAWSRSTGSGDVKVAVIDTGIVENHPDLAGRISSDGYDFITDMDNSGDGDGMDNNPSDPGSGMDNPLCQSSWHDKSAFHGTHVAGIIAARTDNQLGVSGVTWQGEIMNLRALGCYGGTSFAIANAIRYAAGLDNYSGILLPEPAQVANLSFGSFANSVTLRNAVTEAWDAGLIMVAAAGNSSSSYAHYPAAYPEVISVSASTRNNDLASYSNYGATIDLTAPGGDDSGGVISTRAKYEDAVILPYYGEYQGTSMAAPHVAGVTALMKGLYPELSPVDMQALIVSGEISVDLGEPELDSKFGFGLIDALKAVDFAQRLADGVTVPKTPILTLSKSRLNFASLATQSSVEVGNRGNAPLQISSIAVSDAYIEVEALEGDGLGTYVIRIDRTGLAEGDYAGYVVFGHEGGDRTLPISFRVQAQEAVAYGGNLHVLLKEIGTGQIVGKTSIDSAVSGSYRFVFSAVPPGHYNIIAGLDVDNNGAICDFAEVCGRLMEQDTESGFLLNHSQSEHNFSLNMVEDRRSDSIQLP